MTFYTLKKFIQHLAFCAAAWLAVYLFSREGSLYAGWAAGVLGAIYLLAAWFSYLKSKGTDFMKLIRRKRPPQVPYYLRGSDKRTKTTLTINNLRHEFDDDLAEAAAERENERFPLKTRQRLSALAWLAVGIVMLAWSLF
ncbi:MAG TPA: hypothetical protein VN540_05455 [Clostridia bacterium]|nr:hypothetical protein [Clostridia bacterium]